MFGSSIKLFTVFGFDIKLHLSWFILAFLIVWTLAVGFFPFQFPGLAANTYWVMGMLGAVGMFFSIVIHELAHSVIARQHGIQMKGITLFVFGGVAEMEQEPPNARSELLMAIAGPIASVGLGVICFILYFTGLWPVAIAGVLQYLAFINIILAVFNMIPAFPLDGGRVLRAYLWKRRGNLRSATRTASSIGSGFGVALIILGVVNVFLGNFIGGMWLALIGLFVKGASEASYQRVQMREILAGEPVHRFMKTDLVTVSPDVTAQELAEDYVYRHHFKMYPVVRESRLVGCVSTENLKGVPRAEWMYRTVSEFQESCTDENVISPYADALEALTRMNRSGRTRLMVVEHGNLAGIIALRDLLSFLSVKMELEPDLDSDSEKMKKMREEILAR